MEAHMFGRGGPLSRDLSGDNQPAPGSAEEDRKGKGAEMGMNLAFSRNQKKVSMVKRTRSEQ